MPLLDGLFYSPSVESLFSDAARVQAMLDFEAALARAEAKAGLIPSGVAQIISSNCRAEQIDYRSLVAAAPIAGNLAIPLIKQLTALVAKQDSAAARFVHLGTTSQDVIDTGLVLQIRSALDPILSELDSLCDTLATLAETHRRTPIVARTWLQQALPTSFGFIIAGWLDALLRHRGRLLAQGTVPEVRKLLSRHPRRVEIRAREARRLARALVALEDVSSVKLTEGGARISIETHDLERFFAELTEVAPRERAGITSLESHDANLEAVFDYLVG